MPPIANDEKENPNSTAKAINELGSKYNELLEYSKHLSKIVEIQAGIITNLYAGFSDSIPEKYMKNDFFKRVASLVIDLNKTIKGENAKEKEANPSRSS